MFAVATLLHAAEQREEWKDEEEGQSGWQAENEEETGREGERSTDGMTKW